MVRLTTVLVGSTMISGWVKEGKGSSSRKLGPKNYRVSWRSLSIGDVLVRRSAGFKLEGTALKENSYFLISATLLAT